MERDNKTPDFEQALAELERLVERLERGDLPLDEALKTFAEGWKGSYDPRARMR